MLEESPHEVGRIEGEESAAVAATTVTIAEGYPTVSKSHQSFVSDGDALSVAAEVSEHLVRAGHGRFQHLGEGFFPRGSEESRGGTNRPQAAGRLAEVVKAPPMQAGFSFARRVGLSACRAQFTGRLPEHGDGTGERQNCDAKANDQVRPRGRRCPNPACRGDDGDVGDGVVARA